MTHRHLKTRTAIKPSALDFEFKAAKERAVVIKEAVRNNESAIKVLARIGSLAKHDLALETDPDKPTLLSKLLDDDNIRDHIADNIVCAYIKAGRRHPTPATPRPRPHAPSRHSARVCRPRACTVAAVLTACARCSDRRRRDV